MIIKLTEMKKSDDSKKLEAPIFVNMNHVQYFAKSMKGNDTHISIPGKNYLFVKETPEQIMSLLNSPVDLTGVNMRTSIGDMRKDGAISADDAFKSYGNRYRGE